MNSIVEFLGQTAGTVFFDDRGRHHPFRLSPGLTEKELSDFETSLPCALPEEMRELLRFATGCEGLACRLGSRFAVEEICFADFQGFGFEEVFPHAKELAVDGCGNSWVLDLTSESKTFAPIFFACHDPPVIVYQTDSLLHFVREMVRGSTAPWKSEIADVKADFTTRIWRENPCVLSHSQCLSGDSELKTFAQTFDETWEFVDLRKPQVGDGYTWGRYGARTSNKRYGDKRIFARQKKTFGRRLIDALR